MHFSNRTSWNLAENDFATAVRAHRAAGRELADLTVANPTSCGFHYDAQALLCPLSDAESLVYEPASLGMRTARTAVAQYYRDGGADVLIERICLTTSTSEAYSFLFRLLCNPGDEVLVAQPSYPLFEYIAQLDDVKLRAYPLLYDPNDAADSDHSWAIDLHGLQTSITATTKAIILVHPNNPTGNFVSDVEREALESICAERGLALIVDEVFLDYALGTPRQSFVAGKLRCLTFVLSGLSKVCGLPQMKASWIAACGPPSLVQAAMERIELIADTFLSMNAPVQFALPVWLAQRHTLQQQIRERLTQNLIALDARLAGTTAHRLAIQGGWTAILRVPRTVDGKPFAVAALDRGVLVQPGEFYGMSEARVVVSLLTPPDIWSEGLNRLQI